MLKTSLLTVLLLPALLPAQARYQPDPDPDRNPLWQVGGAQVMQRPGASPRRPIASQFDSSGVRPMGEAGDWVTAFYFPDGANLTRSRQMRIRARQRFMPPVSWRRACDAVAHPGWMFTLDAPATSSFAVVVPGRHEMPVRREPPPLAREGVRGPYMAWADSVYQRYRIKRNPTTERADARLWLSFFDDTRDAGLGGAKMIGVRGPGGYNYAVFSVWMRDDQSDGTPNTTATWVVNGWGIPVARSNGNVDIYGTSDSDGDGIDEVVTSAGLVRWDGERWAFPEVYRDEPCMLRRVMSPPPGVTP